LIALDPYEEFRAFHDPVNKRCSHFQAPWDPAEKMDSANEQIEQGSSLFLYPYEGDRGLLIKTEDGFVS
jgi:hypothetical protein